MMPRIDPDPTENARHGSRPSHARMVVPTLFTDFVKLSDAALVIGGALFASLLAASGITAPIGPRDRYTLVTILAATLFVAIAGRCGGYGPSRLADRWAQFRIVGVAGSATLALLLGLGFLIKITSDFSRAWTLVWAASSLVSLLVLRAGVAWRIGAWSRAGRLRRRVAVIGPRAAALATTLRTDSSLSIAGVADGNAGDAEAIAEVLMLARSVPLDEIILAVSPDDGAALSHLVAQLREVPVDLRLALPGLASVLASDGKRGAAPVPMLSLVAPPLRRGEAATKRAEDMALGAALLAAAVPVMAVVALAVLVCDGRPVLFAQDRFGFNNKRIRVLKFRTMRADADPSGARPTAPGDARVTGLGRFLRAWSLDELPQLLNVLRGDMSLVGPRPHAVAMQVGESRYEDAVGGYFRRHRVRPGMTGLAQVMGLRGELRGSADAERRLQADLDYIEHWSLGLDLRILLRTAHVVLTRRNAY